MSKIVEGFKQIKGFSLVNAEKLERAILGQVGKGGKLEGGVGEEATGDQVLAEYDRLGGLILTKDGEKVATGSFYDFETRKPRKEANVKLVEEHSLPATTVDDIKEGEDNVVRKRRAAPKPKVKKVVVKPEATEETE